MASCLQQISAYYQSRLEVNVDAQEYLTRRGIGLAEAVTTFGIGFCDRSLGLRIPHSRVKAGNELRNRLIELGVLRSTGHEHLRGCVTFPVTDASGVTQIYGRRIQERRFARMANAQSTKKPPSCGSRVPLMACGTKPPCKPAMKSLSANRSSTR